MCLPWSDLSVRGWRLGAPPSRELVVRGSHRASPGRRLEADDGHSLAVEFLRLALAEKGDAPAVEEQASTIGHQEFLEMAGVRYQAPLWLLVEPLDERALAEVGGGVHRVHGLAPSVVVV